MAAQNGIVTVKLGENRGRFQHNSIAYSFTGGISYR